MDLQLLDQTLAAHGQPRFRAEQIWEWAARGAAGYEQMTNIPLALRETLARELPFSSLRLQSEAHARDGTVKALFATADGRAVEAVLMRYRDSRRSICVSSQSGCPLTCTFCATGSMRFGRNLSPSEILDQALHFRRLEATAAREVRHNPAAREAPRGPAAREAPRGPAAREARHAPAAREGASSAPASPASPSPAPISHCVFMGMGEPMLNLDAVLAACERLPHIGIAHRRTAISTVGWIPGIERLAQCDMPLRLALSLHAAENSLRSELMPVNERYPLADVIEACRAFYAVKRRRVFVEYVMLAGVNDRYEQALALARVLAPPRADQPQMFKVNLIPYNPTDSPYAGSGRESIAAFRAALESRGIEATVRLTRGRDIDAACGQLAARADIRPVPPALQRNSSLTRTLASTTTITRAVRAADRADLPTPPRSCRSP